jgi:hypothetical protein
LVTPCQIKTLRGIWRRFGIWICASLVSKRRSGYSG